MTTRRGVLGALAAAIGAIVWPWSRVSAADPTADTLGEWFAEWREWEQRRRPSRLRVEYRDEVIIGPRKTQFLKDMRRGNVLVINCVIHMEGAPLCLADNEYINCTVVDCPLIIPPAKAWLPSRLSGISFLDKDSNFTAHAGEVVILKEGKYNVSYGGV